MRSFSELTRHERRIEIIRWFCVLPAACLGELAAAFLARSVWRGVVAPRFANDGPSAPLYWIGLSLPHALTTAAFVLAGSKLAPRRQLATAVVLAILGFIRSLMTHVVVQHLAGNTVGRVNYVHFLADTAGLLCGAAYIAFETARRRKPVNVRTAESSPD